jgi:hypothetical protein
MAPTFGALALARIYRIADAWTAKIAAHSFEELCHAPPTQTVKPRPQSAKMAASPGHADFLSTDLIEQFQKDQVAGSAHLHDAGPPQ